MYFARIFILYRPGLTKNTILFSTEFVEVQFMHLEKSFLIFLAVIYTFNVNFDLVNLMCENMKYFDILGYSTKPSYEQNLRIYINITLELR